MVRAPFFDENGVKKGAWSPEEDSKLKAYIEKYGHWNWRELPKFAGLSRCGKSCRLRWKNYLRPNLKRGNFTEEEENIILRLHAEIGNKWSVIAAKLPGRTDNEIKNHWHTHLKKRENQNSENCESSQQYHSDTSRSEDIQYDQETRFEGIQEDALSHSILESSPLSPETPSSELSITSNFTNLNIMNQTHEDVLAAPAQDVPVAVQDGYDDVNGDFWTQPFVADNVYFQNYGNTSTQIPFHEGSSSGVAYSDISYYDDGEDLMYQVMQEMGGK